MVRYLLPKLRAYIVKILVEERGWSLSAAARALGISTTAASKYKRILGERSELDEVLEREARRAVESVRSPRDLVRITCNLCYSLRVRGPLCRLHLNLAPELGECNLCAELPLGEVSAERLAVLSNLTEALERAHAFSHLVPEVRTNIAMAVRGAETRMDVAAFPGRLTVVKGRLVAFGSPEFGASRHLATVLLSVMRIDPEVRGATCIKYTDRVGEALRSLGFKYVVVKRDAEPGMEPLFKELSSLRERVDAIVDPGGPGIEPVVYIFGVDAVDAVEKASRISKLVRELNDQ